MSVRTIALAMALGVALAPGTAGAQERDPAREAFIAGLRAVEEHRVADALAHFERAYELGGNPAALYNVVHTLYGTGRFRETVAAADRLLRLHPALAPDLRQRTEELRADARARLARLVLVSRPEEASLRLDGALAEPEGDPPMLIVDPGAHELSAEAPGFLPFVWRGRLVDGEVRALRVELEPRPSGDTSALAWGLGIGGGVVAIAAIVVAAVLANDAAQLTPIRDDVLRP